MAVSVVDVDPDLLAAHVARVLMDLGGAAVIIGQDWKDRREFFQLIHDTLSSNGAVVEQLPAEIVKTIADHVFVAHLSAEEKDRRELSELVRDALNSMPGPKARMFLRDIRAG